MVERGGQPECTDLARREVWRCGCRQGRSYLKTDKFVY